MDSEYLQYTRYKLQKRLKRLNTAEFNEFHEILVQCWAFLNSSPLTAGHAFAALKRGYSLGCGPPCRVAKYTG